jgi:molecular chaperone HtpG
MQQNERSAYEQFFDSFGKTLKYGLYSGFGSNKEELQDLTMYYSSDEKKLVTLNEYVSRMKEDQKYIYYATGENNDKISKLPQTEAVLDKGYEILYFTDEVDEFAIKVLMNYKEKEFKNISSSDLDLGDEEKDKESENENKENMDIFNFMKESLGGKIAEVKASKRLKNHPVCLSSKGDLSIEMEKVLSAMPDGNSMMKAEKILEINPNHEMFNTIKNAYDNDKEKLKKIANVLYNQALLIEGLSIDDPVQYANDVCELMK